MFDSWDDYAKAVFNPAASTYDMIMEADEGIRQHEKEAKQQKREQAQKDAEAKAKLADKRRSEQDKEAAHEKDLTDKYGKDMADDILSGKTTEQAAAAATGTTPAASSNGVVSVGSEGMGADNSKLIIGAVAVVLLGAAVYAGTRRK